MTFKFDLSEEGKVILKSDLYVIIITPVEAVERNAKRLAKCAPGWYELR